MPTEFPGLLLWGVPGLLVWLVGQVFVFRAALTRHERSLRGLRLTTVGFGLFMLGLTVGVSIAAVARGVWFVAVVLAVGPGLSSLFIFRWAGRVGVSTGDSAGDEMAHPRKSP
jgi:O-antigen/teichoic acid export membrane protein